MIGDPGRTRRLRNRQRLWCPGPSLAPRASDHGTTGMQPTLRSGLSSGSTRRDPFGYPSYDASDSYPYFPASLGIRSLKSLRSIDNRAFRDSNKRWFSWSSPHLRYLRKGRVMESNRRRAAACCRVVKRQSAALVRHPSSGTDVLPAVSDGLGARLVRPRKRTLTGSPYHRRLVCETLEARTLLSVGLAPAHRKQAPASPAAHVAGPLAPWRGRSTRRVNWPSWGWVRPAGSARRSP